MSLRVLLADESTTIKKVIQLALQDFGVEVKAVPSGLDVLTVTKAFHPDIIFTDVLLPKRSGYEVSAELKKDPTTAHIPVVIMWSGFLELDENKFSYARADGKLEKPFDAEALRELVYALVPKAKSNPISPYLSFPDMPEFTEEPPTPSQNSSPDVSDKTEVISLPQEMAPDSHERPEISTENFQIHASTDLANETLQMAEDEFQQVPLHKQKFQQPPLYEDPNFASKYMIPQEELTNAHVEVSGEFEEISFDKESQSSSASINKNSSVDPDLMENIIRQEAREVIENICWKILPEIIEKIAKDEINKVLREAEKG